MIISDSVKFELQTVDALRLLLEQVPVIKHLTVQQEQQLGASYEVGLIARFDVSGDLHTWCAR